MSFDSDANAEVGAEASIEFVVKAGDMGSDPGGGHCGGVSVVEEFVKKFSIRSIESGAGGIPYSIFVRPCARKQWWSHCAKEMQHQIICGLFPISLHFFYKNR